MTKKEKAIEMIRVAFDVWEEEYGMYDDWSEEHEARDMAIKALEQEPCEDTISRQAVLDNAYAYGNGLEPEGYCVNIEDIQALPSVAPTPKWIPVSEKLPKAFRFVNCTCHSLIDNREDWVVETFYMPQPSGSPYSDWGNIPMLNDGKCEVIAWMYRNIPEPYRAGMEG